MRRYSSLRIIIAAIALTLAAFNAAALAQVGKGPQPHLEVNHDYFYFGYMPFNAIVQHHYWIRNTGVDTLQIVKVKPGCGCTAAPISNEQIAPGDSAELKVIFDSKNMIGKMVKEVEIFSNDPRNSATAIKFFAVVNKEHDFVKAVPNTLRFSKFGAKDGKMIKTVDITNGYDHDIEVSLIELPAQNFKIDKKSAKIRKGEKATFTIEQLRSVTDENDVMTSATFEFVGIETDRVTVPLFAHLQTAGTK